MARDIGYARVSSADQDLTTQKATLEQAGCALVFEQKITGTKRDGREQLGVALKVLTKGDTLVVTRLDRLGRSLRDLANIAHELEEKGAALRVIEQNVDTSTSAGRAFFGMLATFAQFETDVRRERQAEGIARVKRNGERRVDGRLKYAGRKPSVPRGLIVHLRDQGKKPSEIARELDISRMSVWRTLKSAPAPLPASRQEPKRQDAPGYDPTMCGDRLRNATQAWIRLKQAEAVKQRKQGAKGKKGKSPKK